MSFWSWIGLADKEAIAGLQSEIKSLREENRILLEQNCRLTEKIEQNDSKFFENVINGISNIQKKNEENYMSTINSIEKIAESQSTFQDTIVKIDTHIDEYMLRLKDNDQRINKNIEELQQLLKIEVDNIQKKIDSSKGDIFENIQANSRLLTDEKTAVITEVLNCTENVKDILSKLQEKLGESNQLVLDNNQMINEDKKQIKDITNILTHLEQETKGIDILQENISSIEDSLKYFWSIMKAVWVDSVLSDIDSKG